MFFSFVEKIHQSIKKYKSMIIDQCSCNYFDVRNNEDIYYTFLIEVILYFLLQYYKIDPLGGTHQTLAIVSLFCLQMCMLFLLCLFHGVYVYHSLAEVLFVHLKLQCMCKTTLGEYHTIMDFLAGE